MPLPGDQVTGPHRQGQSTMDHEVEAGAQHLRDHLRRTHHPRQQPTMHQIQIHRLSDTPHSNCIRGRNARTAEEISSLINMVIWSVIYGMMGGF